MPSRLTTTASLGVLILVWGTTWGAIKIGLGGIPPFTGVALRFGLAALVLLPFVPLLGVRLGRSRREVVLWVVNGMFSFVVSYGIVYWGEQYVPSGLTAVLFATFPLFVALFAHGMLPGERLTVRRSAGIAVGFAGVAVIFSEDLAALGQGQVAWAAALILLSPVSAAFANVAVKRWGEGLHPLSLTIVPMALTGLVTGAIAAVAERGREVTFDAVSVGALLYLAIFGTALTFSLYFWLLARLPATQLALITYATPVVAVAVGAAFLDEPVTGLLLAGSGLVVAGVALATRVGRGGQDA